MKFSEIIGNRFLMEFITKMKAIIVATGMGNRLMPLTNGKPKCMLKIVDKTIMQLQLGDTQVMWNK